MNKALNSLAAVAVVVVLSTAACTAGAPASATAAPGVPTFAGGPTTVPLTTSGSSNQPTATGAAVAPQVPICQAADTCQALDAVQMPLDCVKKVPYTNVLVPLGTKFEVQDQSGAFICDDTGTVVNGKEVVTCHGKELFSFQLKLTNAACNGANLQTDTGQCQQGYGYDAAKNCCSPASGGADGFAMVTVNLGGCPLPNSSKP